MEQYKPNSDKARENAVGEKKVEKIVTGPVKTKKKSEMQKFMGSLISEDAGNLKDYVYHEVFIPMVQKTISEIITTSVEILFHGESNRSKRNSNAGRVSYRSYYDKQTERKDYGSRARTAGYAFEEVILDSRGEAEEVLARMDELIVEYKLVSVGDYYDMVGVRTRYTDYKYGWTNLDDARVERVRGEGFVINLPRTTPLN